MPQKILSIHINGHEEFIITLKTYIITLTEKGNSIYQIYT